MKSHDAMVKTWVNNSASGELSSIHGYGVMSFYSVYIYTYPIYTQYNNGMVFYMWYIPNFLEFASMDDHNPQKSHVTEHSIQTP